MITAITNKYSRLESGTSYYSNGCLYTTTYSGETTSTVPYVSTVTDTGTFYTYSNKTITLETHLGEVSTNFWWGAKSSFDYRVEPYTSASLTFDACCTGTTYSRTATTDSFTPEVGEYSYTDSHENGIWWTWTNTSSAGAIVYSTRHTTASDYEWYSRLKEVKNLYVSIEYENSTYTVSFSDSNDFAGYTSGSGPYGPHSGSTYEYESNTYTSFYYISRRSTIEDTTLSKDVYTTEGTITKEYIKTNSSITLYPNVTYTISSCFNGYCQSTSEKQLFNVYTSTLNSTGTIPSAESGLYIQYYKTGCDYTTQVERYAFSTTGFRTVLDNADYVFSVRNQRDKSYLIAIDKRAYIIPPYYESFIGKNTAATKWLTLSDNKYSYIDVTTARAATYTRAYIDVYQIDSWNTTSWGNILDTSYLNNKIMYPIGITNTISNKGITLGNSVYSANASDVGISTHSQYGYHVLYGDYSSFTTVSYKNVSDTLIDTTTEAIECNGYRTMSYNYSYTITTTYQGEATHFITEETE